MFRSFKGTDHIRDMYEICTAQVRDLAGADAGLGARLRQGFGGQSRGQTANGRRQTTTSQQVRQKAKGKGQKTEMKGSGH